MASEPGVRPPPLAANAPSTPVDPVAVQADRIRRGFSGEKQPFRHRLKSDQATEGWTLASIVVEQDEDFVSVLARVRHRDGEILFTLSHSGTGRPVLHEGWILELRLDNPSDYHTAKAVTGELVGYPAQPFLLDRLLYQGRGEEVVIVNRSTRDVAEIVEAWSPGETSQALRTMKTLPRLSSMDALRAMVDRANDSRALHGWLEGVDAGSDRDLYSALLYYTRDRPVRERKEAVVLLQATQHRPELLELIAHRARALPDRAVLDELGTAVQRALQRFGLVDPPPEAREQQQQQYQRYKRLAEMLE